MVSSNFAVSAQNFLPHFSQASFIEEPDLCGSVAPYFLRSIAFRRKFVEVILEKSGLERMSLGDASVYGACLTEFFFVFTELMLTNFCL